MIKAQELRIGNLFQLGKFETPETIRSIQYDRRTGYVINNGLSEDDLTPIPLTPEVLTEWCGFSKIDND